MFLELLVVEEEHPDLFKAIAKVDLDIANTLFADEAGSLASKI